MTGQSGDKSLPLDDVMMAMDVVDTLRHRQDLVLRELSGDARDAALISRLREIYHDQGIEVPDHILRQGVEGLKQDRFTYHPPAPGFARNLAVAYVSRGSWGKWVLGLGAVLVLGLGAWFLAYLPYQAAQTEAARIELAETMPAQMQALYDTIYEETKVQSAAETAELYLQRGQAAAAEQDRAAAEDAIARLTTLRDELRREYELRVVNREGIASGFWTFPDVNESASNYYLVVEAIDEDGQALTLPIENEENGQIENVAAWGLRVPESVYNSVVEDKQDDGIIQRNLVGAKEYGFLDIKYAVPTLDGTVTRW